MSEPAHGKRWTYRCGCRCLLCRAANASYIADLRRRHRLHLPILGQLVSAGATWRRVRSLETEGYSRGEIAARLGLQTPLLQWQHRRVTLRTQLRVAALWRQTTQDCGPVV